MTRAALRVARLLWPTFRRLLIRIGRWVARELVAEGAKGLAAILRAGVRRIKGKLADERERKKPRPLRLAFLRGRIRRWQRAAKWIDRRIERLKKGVISALDSLLDDAIPERSPLEHYDRWRRTPEGRRAAARA